MVVIVVEVKEGGAVGPNWRLGGAGRGMEEIGATGTWAVLEAKFVEGGREISGGG